MLRLRTLFAGSAIAVLAAVELPAQTVFFTSGTVMGTGGVSNFRTLGSMMDGMTVRATFSDGSIRNGVWGSIGGGLYGISDGGWYTFSLGALVDSYDGPFSLNSVAGPTRALSSIRMNGAGGRTLFDCDWSGTACKGPGGSAAEGTVNSAIGFTFQDAGGFGPIPITATYSNLVGVIPNVPVGDLFEQLEFSFGGGGLQGQYRLRFDTDNASSSINVVPEPSTYALMGAGLLALVAIRRRRQA